MQMGETESEYSYVKRVYSSINNLILAGSKGALCYSKTIVAAEKPNPTEK